MKVEVYKFGQIGLRKVLGYFYLGIIIFGIGSMIKGPVGSNESLYSRHDAPVWVYVLTFIVIVAVAIIYFDSIFSPIKPIGSVEIGSEELIIKLKKKTKRIPYVEVKELAVLLEYRHDKVDPDKNNRRLSIKGTEYEITLDITLDKFQEEKINEHIKAIGLALPN